MLSKLVRTEPVSKQLGGRQKNKTKKSHTEERKEPYDALERTERKKAATRRERCHKKSEKGKKDIKEKWRKT